MTDLTDTEQQMLDLERSWFKHPGAKESVIHERFGVTATRYYQQLNALIERPEALAHDPMTVKRLRRLREQRRKQRSMVARSFQ